MGDSVSWARDLPTLLPDTWRRYLGGNVDHALERIGRSLDSRALTEEILPPKHRVFRALITPPEEVEVLIIGQDPYPTPGQATGLAFSVPHGVWPLPPTLKNILRELADDTGVEIPHHGNLQSWQDRGVLLVNRHLTTAAHHPGAHHSIGWAEVTDTIVATLARTHPHLVAILWGRHAQQLAPLLRGVPTISSPHPSPLSARRGFFGSKPFSRVNEYREAMGRRPIDWALDDAPGCQAP